MGERPGDPHRIGPDDLRLAVDSAQATGPGSRLVSADPTTAGGQPVWVVTLLTEGPGLKHVVVDPVWRGAKANDAPVNQDEAARVLQQLNSAKTFWPDAVDTARKQVPNSTLGRVVLAGAPGNPAAPVWRVTLLTPDQQVETVVDGTNGAVLSQQPGQRKRQDFG
jgi:hypothetical protein